MVVLVAPFGAVEGKAVADDSGLTVEITVEVDRTFEAVLVRPFSSFQELPPTALQPIGNDMWGGLVTLPTAEDWNLVFDGLEAGGETFRSDSVTLTEIGVDPVVVAGEPIRLPDRAIDTATWWLIGGIAGALSALAALAWWTFGSDATESEVLDRDESDQQPEERET
ncbi:MAG: hypothetical protein DRJ28_03600 [Actinobacteria bacterium]|nr:MAG: hypothetical protein DRJ28_03600 [Actinomycetota bacterium]